MKRSTFVQALYVRPRQPVVPAARMGVVARIGGEVRSVPKGEKAKPGKGAPTVLEAKWLDAVVRFGCVACWLDKNQSRPTVPHHLLRGGVRMGHLFTIGLCDPGHHQDGQPLGLISRHPFKARFEARYGKEFDLLARLKVELGVFSEASYG